MVRIPPSLPRRDWILNALPVQRIAYGEFALTILAAQKAARAGASSRGWKTAYALLCEE